MRGKIIEFFSINYQIQDIQICKQISTFIYTEFYQIFRTIHLYIGRNFDPLKRLLIQYSERAAFDYLNPTDQVGTNVWLIHVTSYKAKRQLLKTLKTSPLRFDSQLYEFHEQVNGN